MCVSLTLWPVTKICFCCVVVVWFMSFGRWLRGRCGDLGSGWFVVAFGGGIVFGVLIFSAGKLEDGLRDFR